MIRSENKKQIYYFVFVRYSAYLLMVGLQKTFYPGFCRFTTNQNIHLEKWYLYNHFLPTF